MDGERESRESVLSAQLDDDDDDDDDEEEEEEEEEDIFKIQHILTPLSK